MAFIQPEFHSDCVKSKVQQFNVGKEERKKHRDIERAVEITNDPIVQSYYTSNWQQFKSKIIGVPSTVKTSASKCGGSICGWKSKLFCCLTCACIVVIVVVVAIIVWQNKGLIATAAAA